ncbi:sirohydrochlorin chelatase [Thalassobacillus pellis]|uniref:sirohydrochlorin chelatase n=1 Tax=Thalassobacillus pellis TaxID=748008 RepID=UPI001961BEC6|nr:sirohydrochlorin chelatase [Thalassobacillus pellis]MBM7551332.1 sirohydrochlorin ferrochelatase [Thalassobacillus pellis]
MLGILYVCHGSRLQEARNEAVSCIETVKKRIDVPLQEICFLEIADPDMNEGFARLVQQGASEITVVPVLLLSAGHYYQDIPEAIAQAQIRYPDIQIVYGKPLGVQDRIIEVLVDRVEETKATIYPGTNLLLVGRGSHNPETPKSMEQIKEKLQTKISDASVNVCYLAACSPSFDEGLQASIESDFSQTIVVPYLWFTGVLIHSMEKKVNDLRENGHSVSLCNYLGSHPFMIDALADRVQEAMEQKYEEGIT